MSCKTMSIDLANVPPVPIQIGVAGENSFRTITFDASTWGADFPDATYTVVYRRSDGYMYPVLVNAAADEIVWSPTETDTAVSGNGQLEVRLLDGETIGKTIIMQTYVAPSLSGDETEPGTPAPDWVNDVADDADRAEQAVSHYPKIVNGVWHVWSVDAEDFVSTGIEAQGADGVSPTVTVTAITGGHRVTITDATGPHTFDVMDGEGGSGSGTETVVVTLDDSTDPMTASMNSTQIKAAVDASKRVVIQHADNEIPFLAQADTVSVFSAAIYSGTPTGVAILVTANGTATVTTTELVQSVNGQSGAVTVKEPIYLTTTESGGKTYVDKTPAEIAALAADGYDVHLLRTYDSLYHYTIDYRFAWYSQFASFAVLTAEYGGSWYYAQAYRSGGDVTMTEVTFDEGELYSKPSGGIPKTDLASNVQTSLGKADTAVQSTVLEALLSSYATKLFVEGKGYQTAQQVQTAIAAIPDELPTVTASDNGKFLRVVSGAWAAETVQTYQGGSY